MFDEIFVVKPWNDSQVGELLLRRSAAAAIEPIFDDLLERLSPAADEFDRQEALASKRAGYFRMVWDFVRGNPALALEVWGASLIEDGRGQVRVRSLQVPDATELEALPDSALFVLRAILQMSPASAEEVAQATRLTEPEVRDVFDFGLARGFLIETTGRMGISWAWIRAVVVLLRRRHLLVHS